jgi:hypothetical protein
MKTFNKIKYFLLILITIITLNSYAQGGPGDPGGDPEGTNDPLGGGAPIFGGTFILIALGAFYGGRKIFLLKNLESKEENP